MVPAADVARVVLQTMKWWKTSWDTWLWVVVLVVVELGQLCGAKCSRLPAAEDHGGETSVTLLFSGTVIYLAIHLLMLQPKPMFLFQIPAEPDGSRFSLPARSTNEDSGHESSNQSHVTTPERSFSSFSFPKSWSDFQIFFYQCCCLM